MSVGYKRVMAKLFIAFIMPLVLTACGNFGKMPEWLVDDAYKLPPAELVDITPEYQPEIVWQKDTGAASKDSYANIAPWLQGDRIVTVDYKGTVKSFFYKTGKLAWEIKLDESVATGVGGEEGIILVGTQDGEVITLDEVTGRFLWRANLSSELLSPPKIGLGVVVARTADGRVSGLSSKDGSILWNYQRSVPLLSLRGVSAPILAGDKVVIGYANGKLVALSIYDGKVIWEKSIAVPRGRTEIDRLVDIDADPVVKLGRVYVVTYHGNLAGVDLQTGQTLWSREMSSRTGLDVDPGYSIYVSDESSHVWAIQDGTGDALWRQTSLLRRQISPPAIVSNAVLVGDLEGYLHWLAREDGRFIARIKVADKPIRSKPVVHDNLVFVAANNGSLTALRVE